MTSSVGFDFADIYDRAVAEVADGGVFVEVGSFLGRSTAYLADAVRRSGKSVTLYAVDTWEGADDITGRMAGEMQQDGFPLYERFVANVAACGLTRYVRPVRCDSVAAADRFADGSVDFVFIDADHSCEAVYADIAAWWPKVKPGGVIAGHDYDERGVKTAVDAVFGPGHATSLRSWAYTMPPR